MAKKRVTASAKKAQKPAAARKSARTRSPAKTTPARSAPPKRARCAGKSPVDMAAVHEIIQVMEAHHLTEFEIDHRDFHVRLCRGSGSEGLVATPAMLAHPPPAVPLVAGSSRAGLLPPPNEPAEEEGTIPVNSPMVGTVYRSASPDADPYISVGDRVTEETVVCIIEAMKVMNEIKAEVEGEVVAVLVENGEPVEYGQPILVVRPPGSAAS